MTGSAPPDYCVRTEYQTEKRKARKKCYTCYATNVLGCICKKFFHDLIPLLQKAGADAPVFWYGKMLKQIKPMVLYICDGTKCKPCSEECHHTASRFYARDTEHEFVEIAGNLWEVPKPWDKWTLAKPE